MIVFGVTGSIASGKTTATYLMAGKKYPLFNADMIVTNLYKKKDFNNILIKKFHLNSKVKVKNQIRPPPPPPPPPCLSPPLPSSRYCS